MKCTCILYVYNHHQEFFQGFKCYFFQQMDRGNSKNKIKKPPVGVLLQQANMCTLTIRRIQPMGNCLIIHTRDSFSHCFYVVGVLPNSHHFPFMHSEAGVVSLFSYSPHYCHPCLIILYPYYSITMYSAEAILTAINYHHDICFIY